MLYFIVIIALLYSARGLSLLTSQQQPRKHMQMTMNAAGAKRQQVTVVGATGRLGRLVVNELLSSDSFDSSDVCAIVRSEEKAKEVLPKDNPALRVVKCDISDDNAFKNALKGSDAVVWCAAGFTDAPSSTWQKVKAAFKLKFLRSTSIDILGMATLGKVMAAARKGQGRSGLAPGAPAVVMTSSAGVTRPTWSEEKKQRLLGASDIPIIRLNPLNILGLKRQSEEVLRQSGASYAILRPCGLTEAQGTGRPIFSQGDVSVGRMNRRDVAAVIARLLLSREAEGKTFECFSLPNREIFAFPSSLDPQLQRLVLDTASVPETVVDANYALLQQLVPGKMLAPEQLAMGQTYEQLDAGEDGRLGKRGEENAELQLTN